jgi:hypothetical protein
MPIAFSYMVGDKRMFVGSGLALERGSKPNHLNECEKMGRWWGARRQRRLACKG